MPPACQWLSFQYDFPFPDSADPSIQRSQDVAWIGDGLSMTVWFGNCFPYSTVKIITCEWEILWVQSSFTGAGTNLLLLKLFHTVLLPGRANALSWTPWMLSKSPAFQKNHCLLSLDICKSKTFHVWKIKSHRKNHIHAKHKFENPRILACKMLD